MTFYRLSRFIGECVIHIFLFRVYDSDDDCEKNLEVFSR